MKHLLTLTFLFIFDLTFAQVPSYVPTNSLVGWWPFNGNANDESGNGNNGTVNGATLTNDRFGVANKAYSFDPNQYQYINVAQNSILNNINEISISAWLKPNSNASYSHMVNKSDDANNHQFVLSTNSNGIYFYYGNGSAYYQTNIGPLLNQWNHIIVVYSHNLGINYCKIVLNGSEIGNFITNSSLQSTSYNLKFGSFGNNSINTVKGSLDDIGIWNRALTECEIQDLYHAQVGFTTVDAGPDQTICRGADVTLNGTGGSSLSWNNGVVNGVAFAPNQTSNYVLTGSDSLGCVGTDTVLVTVLDNASSTINQTAIDSYTLNGQTYTQSGTYTQVLTGANGCDSTITLNLELDFTGIQTNTLSSLKLYPNPVQDVLHIDGLAGKEFEYEVLSIDGKLLQKGKSQGEISVKELRKGNYLLRVGQQQVSFVKQ